MSNNDLRSTFREGIVIKSIEVMHKNGVDDKAIKKKMMESFSLMDEEIIDQLLAN